MQYDIFISYKRRGTSSATAAFIYDFLIRKGYTVFFDRKEMSQGYFDNQLNECIDKAKDIIVLLEEGSLASCFGLNKEDYKTDWFCKEIMYALANGKRIVPLLLDGYKMPEENEMPEELKDLTKQNAIDFESFNIEHVYDEFFINKKYLSSSPRNMYLSQLEGNGIADFLFYSNQDSEIYEFGNLVGLVDQSVDEQHPFKLPVRRSGEHRFRVENLDTTEVQTIIETIPKDEQKYVEIKWEGLPNVWENNLLESEKISKCRYQIGVGLYKGNSKYEPDRLKALEYLENDIDGFKFIRNHINEVVNDTKNSPGVILKWLEIAAKSPINSKEAALQLALRYHHGNGVYRDINKAIEYYSICKGDKVASYNLGIIYKKGEGVNKSLDKARIYLLKAVQGGYEDAYLPLAQVLFENNDDVSARQYLAHVLKKDPENKEALELQDKVNQRIIEEEQKLKEKRDRFFSKERFSVGLLFEAIKINMILVQSGKMTMQPTTELTPRNGNYMTFAREFSVPRFYISEFPITEEIWHSVMGDKELGSTLLDILKKGAKVFNELTNPMVNVSLTDCREFVSRLSEKTNIKFSIPTEEEWEYAARGGNKSKGYKFAGSNNIDEVAWHKGNSGGELHSVGRKLPNELGIYDMSGNVWEWTETPVHHPAAQKALFLCCGGSYENDCQLSERDSHHESSKCHDVGLRVVIREKDIEKSPQKSSQHLGE